MKKIILSVALAVGAIGAMARECVIVVPQNPGGAHDIYARLMQKTNPDIKIEYRPGAYGVPAVNYLIENPNAGLVSIPNMFSTKSPLSDPQIEMQKVILSVDQVILTNKGITVDDMMGKKLNVGIPFFGSPAHHIAVQLKQKNPQLNLVPLDGDGKALPLLKSGEVDVYITAAPNARKWVKEFNFTSLVEVANGKDVKFGDIELVNVSIIGIYTSKNSTADQKANMLACVNKSINSAEWDKLLTDNNIRLMSLDGAKKDQALTRYVTHTKQYGL